MKMEIGIMAGAESKAFLVDFKKQLDRLEALTGRLSGGKAAAAAATEEEEEEQEEEESEEDFGAKTKAAAKKTAKSFDDDDAGEEESEEEEESFTKAPAAKAKKAKAYTLDDANDACKARAAVTGGKKGRAEVLALLNKHFKTESVSELKPEQYAKVITVMAV